MADVITSGGATITPILILGYSSKRPTRTVVHDLIDNPAPDYTLRQGGLRTGHLELGFSGPTAEADSAAAEALLSAGKVYALASSERSSAVMSFVLPEGGTLARDLDDTTRDAWVVSFDWQEVAG